MGSKRITVIAGVLGGSLLLGMGAIAGYAVGSEDVIVACADKKNGALRMIDQGTNCKNSEEPVVWNVQGPVGPAGQDGIDGGPGPQGQPGNDGDPGFASIAFGQHAGDVRLEAGRSYGDAWAFSEEAQQWVVTVNGTVDTYYPYQVDVRVECAIQRNDGFGWGSIASTSFLIERPADTRSASPFTLTTIVDTSDATGPTTARLSCDSSTSAPAAPQGSVLGDVYGIYVVAHSVADIGGDPPL